MWEICLLIYVKKELFSLVNHVEKIAIAKGFASMIGNKGAVAYSFVFAEQLFQVTGVHLTHKAERIDERNQMASQLIREMKLQKFQKSREIEADFLSDFAVFFGDLNYRLETTFEELNNETMAEKLKFLVSSKEQLTQAMHDGNFPLYYEMPLTFLPSYKLDDVENIYIDKKNQGPSFCDRILFKNNSTLKSSCEFY